MSQNTFKIHVYLLVIGEEGKKHYVIFQYFNTFMYDHTTRRGKKHFCFYFLQAFSAAGLLKCHVNNFFMINSKQLIRMPETVEYLRFKKYEMKIKSPFMIYADLKVWAVVYIMGVLRQFCPLLYFFPLDIFWYGVIATF